MSQLLTNFLSNAGTCVFCLDVPASQMACRAPICTRADIPSGKPGLGTCTLEWNWVAVCCTSFKCSRCYPASNCGASVVIYANLSSTLHLIRVTRGQAQQATWCSLPTDTARLCCQHIYCP